MEHIYNNIQGWFDYQKLYTKVIQELQNDAHIVELGAWKGCSTAYLAVEVINSNKNIQIDVIDDWKGGGDISSQYDKDNEYFENHGDIFDIFKRNMQPVIHKLNIIRALSKEAITSYTDNSLDFVFIDATHSYESVKEDIRLWLPKIKYGGYIGGHDYNPKDWAGVVQAVNESFSKDKLEIIDSSWLVKII
jgi:cephalosporin hydroxylase